MKVKVLFSYTEFYVPPRCRNPRRRTMHDGEIEVEIREVLPSEAPVALNVRKRDRLRSDGKEGMDVIPHRWAFGHLWTNCRLFNGSRSSFVSGQTDSSYKRPPAVMDNREGSEQRYDSPKHHFLNLDGTGSRDDIEGAILWWAKSVLIVKGLPGMWVQALEPRYVVMTFGLGSNHGGTALMLDSSYNSNVRKDCYFNALEYAKAKAYAKKVATERGDTKSLPISSAHGRIQVLIPEAVRCAPHREAGDGDPFLNEVAFITRAVKSPLLAGALVVNAAVNR